ncbi:MAG TPA: selenoneine biosynthesis selenosugar synthase SenB, partial [Telluria sp.]
YQVAIGRSADYDADSPPAMPSADLLIALHARRSAAAMAAFAHTWPDRPRILVLTGTDLYRDIHHDPSARAALEQATDLVLLQAAGLAVLPPGLKARTHVIHQSAPAMQAQHTGTQQMAVCMIGHLRREKDPLTFMRASALVRNRAVRLLHIGRALEPALGEAASATAHAQANYQWLGDLPHPATRAVLATSHAMAICSHMEGGANVIIEAVTSGVPVLASDINGNRGMLGEDYAGYFAAGDAAALAALIDRSVDDPAFHARLRAQCAARAPLFAPATEGAAVLALVDGALQPALPPAIR